MTSFQERLRIWYRTCASNRRDDKAGNHKYGLGRDFTVGHKPSTATVTVWLRAIKNDRGTATRRHHPPPRGTCTRGANTSWQIAPNPLARMFRSMTKLTGKRQYGDRLCGSTNKCRGSSMSKVKAKRKEGEGKSCQANMRRRQQKGNHQIITCGANIHFSPEFSGKNNSRQGV